jgi:hypothetical protein
MNNLFRRLFWQWKRRPDTLMEDGFHGDRYLLRLVDYAVSKLAISTFIETGANVGTTSNFMAKSYPKIQIYTCEVDKRAFDVARSNLSGHDNVKIWQKKSPDFLYWLLSTSPELADKNILFWLDAHGYGFRWPLVDEIRFITRQFGKGVVMIDDFKIPSRPDFKFDQDEDQVCGFDAIEPAICEGRSYALIYPAYTEHTSKHHPLTGVGLIVWGTENFSLPPDLAGDFKVNNFAR